VYLRRHTCHSYMCSRGLPCGLWPRVGHTRAVGPQLGPGWAGWGMKNRGERPIVCKHVETAPTHHLNNRTFSQISTQNRPRGYTSSIHSNLMLRQSFTEMTSSALLPPSSALLPSSMILSTPTLVILLHPLPASGFGYLDAVRAHMRDKKPRSF
jgi:hypothetical protein